MDINDIGERQVRPPVRAVKVGRDDNVALLLSDVRTGEVIVVNGSHLEVAQEDIPAGYRIAACSLEVGALIVAGNQVIGTALRAVEPGQVVHTHHIQDA